MLETRDFVNARLYPDERSVIQDALRSLLQVRPALRLEMAVYRYRAGDISLGKAANLAGVSFEQMREILLCRGAELHFGSETQEEAQAEVAALRSHLDAARR
ncbi:MAG: UPF0175 family protein [Chloroflexi bacterium]|nr:UPF0175 family protein [Chloroflexota bacterium]